MWLIHEHYQLHWFFRIRLPSSAILCSGTPSTYLSLPNQVPRVNVNCVTSLCQQGLSAWGTNAQQNVLLELTLWENPVIGTGQSHIGCEIHLQQLAAGDCWHQILRQTAILHWQQCIQIWRRAQVIRVPIYESLHPIVAAVSTKLLLKQLYVPDHPSEDSPGGTKPWYNPLQIQ